MIDLKLYELSFKQLLAIKNLTDLFVFVKNAKDEVKILQTCEDNEDVLLYQQGNNQKLVNVFVITTDGYVYIFESVEVFKDEDGEYLPVSYEDNQHSFDFF